MFFRQRLLNSQSLLKTTLEVRLVFFTLRENPQASCMVNINAVTVGYNSRCMIIALTFGFNPNYMLHALTFGTTLAA